MSTGTVSVTVKSDLSELRSLLTDMLAVIDKYDGKHDGSDETV